MVEPGTNRLFVPAFGELIDRLSVDQIKEVLLAKNHQSYADEIARLEHDLDMIIAEKDIKLSARLLRIAIVLAQTNLHIWHSKDEMQEDVDHYDEWLKLAHQLNGIRNRMKNLLLEESGDLERSVHHTNVETDSLKWNVSL